MDPIYQSKYRRRCEAIAHFLWFGYVLYLTANVEHSPRWRRPEKAEVSGRRTLPEWRIYRWRAMRINKNEIAIKQSCETSRSRTKSGDTGFDFGAQNVRIDPLLRGCCRCCCCSCFARMGRSRCVTVLCRFCLGGLLSLDTQLTGALIDVSCMHTVYTYVQWCAL